jgi:cytidyltransferase-like protein
MRKARPGLSQRQPRLMAETGAPAVKLEGGVHMAETIAFLTARGVPVMAHVGLTPQSVNTLGGYKVVGRGAEADKVMADARAVEAAGAFSVVLEKVPEGLAGRVITQSLAIPTIGIGAGVRCDGQVLVVDDMLGLFTDFRPKFVKRYAELGTAADEAIAAYAADVRSRAFPAAEHSFPDVCRCKEMTEILNTVADLRSVARGWRAKGETMGVVPTMGALHDGHLSLARRARAECDRVITTIFVNPKQFNNPEDLKKYPRTLEADAACCHGVPVDVVFAPPVEEVYPEGFITTSRSGRVATAGGLHAPGPFRRRGDGSDEAVRHDRGRQGLFRPEGLATVAGRACGWCAT